MIYTLLAEPHVIVYVRTFYVIMVYTLCIIEPYEPYDIKK